MRKGSMFMECSGKHLPSFIFLLHIDEQGSRATISHLSFNNLWGLCWALLTARKCLGWRCLLRLPSHCPQGSEIEVQQQRNIGIAQYSSTSLGLMDYVVNDNCRTFSWQQSEELKVWITWFMALNCLEYEKLSLILLPADMWRLLMYRSEIGTQIVHKEFRASIYKVSKLFVTGSCSKDVLLSICLGLHHLLFYLDNESERQKQSLQRTKLLFIWIMHRLQLAFYSMLSLSNAERNASTISHVHESTSCGTQKTSSLSHNARYSAWQQW